LGRTAVAKRASFYRRKPNHNNYVLGPACRTSRSIRSGGLAHAMCGGITKLDTIVECFKDGFPGMATADIRARILRDNQRNFTPSEELRDGWRRFVIKEGTVDLFEALIQLIATTLGSSMDWADTWFSHLHFGGIHCGTNVLRMPARTQLPAWWNVRAPGSTATGPASGGSDAEHS
jgi:hypothetical protein